MNKTEQYYTIFMEHNEVVGFNETAVEDIDEDAWFKYTMEQNKAIGMRVIVNKGAFVFAAFPISVDVPHVLKLPRNSVFFPVLMTGFKARSNTTSTVLRTVGKKLRKDANIAKMIDSIKPSEVKDFIEHLTRTNTRNSYSQGATDAAEEIKDLFGSLGYDAVLEPFDDRFGPNVVVRIVGEVNPDKWVVVGAHYDSRGRESTSETETAPGANDNGSSMAMIVEILRALKSSGAKLQNSLLVAAFCAEEQGTIGSRALAVKMKEDNTDIIAMLAADMIAYRDPDRKIQIGVPDRVHDPELTALVTQIINTYLPEVEVCTYTGCCTDNRGFHEQGYSTTRFFEACGALDDPQYHTPQDAIDRFGFDIEGELMASIQGISACIFTLAGVI
jgi:leucyl aminopeptidase